MRISDWSSDVCSSDLHRCDVRRFVEISAGGVPTARNVGKPPNFTPESAGGSIWLANQRENLPMIGNGARNAIHRPVGGLSGRGRAREPRGVARPPGAGDRRARHGQGTDRRAPPPPVDAVGPPLWDNELRRAPPDPARKRTTRAPAGP